MKKFSKLLSFVAVLAITLVAPNVYADGNVATVDDVECTTWEEVEQQISSDSDSTIQLLDNVTLDSAFNVATDKNVTLDLNGHKITGPTDGKGYAIENHGTLTIKDSGETKGQIYCANRNNSCVANKSDATKMTIDGVAIASDFIAVKNESNALEVKNSTIEVYFKMYEDKSSNVGAVAIENYGTATIEETTIKAPTVFSNWTSIWTLTDSSPATTTVKNVTVTGNGHIYVGQPGDRDDVTPQSKLIIEGLTAPRSTSFNSYASALVEPDAATTEKVVKRANNGASIVIPEDYEGEVPNIAGVKYVTKEGKEVVYVTFNGVRYELNKGDSWSSSTDKSLQNALAKAKNADNKVFKGFVNGNGEKVTASTQWKENGEIHLEWSVIITLDRVEYTLDLGKDGAAQRMGNATAEDGTRLDDVMKEVPAGKYSVIYYSDGTSISASQKVDSNITLTKEVLVSVTVDGNMFTVSDGTQVQDVENLKKYLEDKKFKYFKGDDGVEYKAEDTLTHNVKLTPVYQIIVAVKDKESKGLMGVGYTATTEGITLREILNASYGSGLKKFIDAANFVEFRDEEGNVVSLDDVITSDITLTAIYNIVLTFTDSEGNTWSVIVPEGTSLEGLKSLEHAILSAEELKNVEGKIFKGFVNAVTGEEIAEDEELTEDTTIKAVYNVRITFTDSEGNTWSVIVPEGTSLEGLKSLEHAILSAEELKDVENKIFAGFVNAVTGEEISEDQEITENISVKVVYNVRITFTDSEGNTWSVIVPEGTSLEELKSLEHAILSAEELKNVEGKIFKRFVNAVTGEEISEDQAITENISVKAIYEEEQTQEPTPVEPTPEEPPVENPSTYDGIMTSVLFVIISFISVVAGAVTFKKSFNVNE